MGDTRVRTSFKMRTLLLYRIIKKCENYVVKMCKIIVRSALFKERRTNVLNVLNILTQKLFLPESRPLYIYIYNLYIG